MSSKKKSMTAEAEHTRSPREQYTPTLMEMQAKSRKDDPQNITVLRHLMEHGSITQREAIREYDIYRLASRIKELRDRNIEIDTVMMENIHNGGHYAKYLIRGKE